MYTSANASLVPARFMLMVTHLVATLTVLYDSAGVAHKAGEKDIKGAQNQCAGASCTNDCGKERRPRSSRPPAHPPTSALSTRTHAGLKAWRTLLSFASRCSLRVCCPARHSSSLR